MNVNITGYGDELTVNGIKIGDLTPKEHEQIEKENLEDNKYINLIIYVTYKSYKSYPL